MRTKKGGEEIRMSCACHPMEEEEEEERLSGV